MKELSAEEITKLKKKVLVAKKVLEAFEEDGFYGPYVLGDDLWDEFSKEFINIQE